jgi:hypothetical protein
MLVRSHSVMLGGRNAGVESLLLFAGNLDDALGGTLLLGSEFQELVDEVGVFLGSLEGGSGLGGFVESFSDDVSGVLGNLLINFLGLLSGVFGRFLGFDLGLLGFLSDNLSFVGELLGGRVGSGLLGSDLGLSGNLGGVFGVLGSSDGSMGGVLLLLHQSLGLQFGEGLGARLLRYGLFGGVDTSGLGSSDGGFGELLGLFLGLDDLLGSGGFLGFLGSDGGGLSFSEFVFGSSLGELGLDGFSGLSIGSFFGSSGGLSSSSLLVSLFLGSEDSSGLLGVLLNKECLHLLLEKVFLCLFLGLLGFFFVDNMEFGLANVNVFDNNLLSTDLLGNLRDGDDLRFLVFNGGSSLLDDLSHLEFSVSGRFFFGLGDGLLHGLLDEVSSSLLDFSNSLGSLLLENLSLSDGSLGLELLFFDGDLSVGLGVRELLLIGGLDSSKGCFASGVRGSNGELGSLLGSFLGFDELSNNLDKFLNLGLSLVGELLNTGVLAFHGRNHGLQLLLDELSLDVTDFLGLLVDM